MTVEEVFARIEEADLNVTFSGGDPMLRPEGFTALARMIKERTSKTIWCYTGYLFEELIGESKAHCECTKEMLMLIDILVDGEFHLEKKDISLAYRGSSNQRIIDVRKSFENGRIELYEPMSGRI